MENEGERTIVVRLSRQVYEVRVVPEDASVKEIKRTCIRCKKPFVDHVFTLIALSVCGDAGEIAECDPLYKEIVQTAKKQYLQSIRDNQAIDYICGRDRCRPEHVEEVDIDSNFLQSICPKCKEQAIAIVHHLDDAYQPRHQL